MMKAISLVFEYDFDKQVESGRTWGKTGYKTKDFIFEYSAASFATFAHHNRDVAFHHEIMTDDRYLLEEKLKQYAVNFSKLSIVEDKQTILSWKNHRYCFNPAMMHLKLYENEKDQLLKLDNDLECKKPLTDLIENKEIIFWKHERNVSKGREYWGEREASRKAFGTENYELYNIGVLGLPSGEKSSLINEMIDAGYKMSEVDISKTVHFPERPELKVSIWSCSEQTAYCYIVQKNNLPIKTCEDYINHHCYGFDSKKDCINAASFLRK